jgi:predicted transcriptional regulator
MTINLSPEMQQKLGDLSAQRQVPPEELIHEALAWYLQIDPELLDEFAAWQEVRDEAWRLVEDSLS